MNITFNITEYCNYACEYCYIADTHAKTFLDKNIFKHIINTATTSASMVTLTGGEPLLHPDFAGILAACRHLRTRVFTNGSLIKRHWDDLLAAMPEIHVSFHKFDRTVRDNINALIAADFAVTLHVVLTQDNALRLDKITEYFSDVSAVILLFPTPTLNNNVGFTPPTVWRERLAAARRRLRNTRKRIYYEVAYKKRRLKVNRYCSGQYASFVNVDGRIYCCCFMPLFAAQAISEIAPMNRFSDCPLIEKNRKQGALCPLYVEPLAG